MAAVFKAGGLTPTHKLVLLALADHASEDGRNVYPGVNRLMLKTGLSERAIRKTLSDLRSKECRLLIVVKKATQHYPTQYAIDLRKLDSMRNPDLHDVPSEDIRPAPDAPLDTPGVHDVPLRGAPGAPKPLINHQSQNKPPRGAKARDERLDHPALIAYKAEARLHIPIAWRDETIATVGDIPLWQSIVHDWIGHGWNKQNIKGMIEAYKAGGIQPKNGRAAHEQEETVFDKLRRQGYG
jgi:hypothetical protein